MTAPLTLGTIHSDRMAGSIPAWLPVSAAAPASASIAAAGPDAGNNGAEAFGFHDLLNIVNPLQHIPGISALYRHFTGDTIKPVSQVLGDTLFGGPLGGMISFVNMLSSQATGHTLAGDALQAIEGKPVTLAPAAAAQGGLPAGQADAATFLRYTDLGGGRRLVYEKISAAGDRMAGTMVHIREEESGSVPNVVVPVGQPGRIHPAG